MMVARGMTCYGGSNEEAKGGEMRMTVEGLFDETDP